MGNNTSITVDSGTQSVHPSHQGCCGGHPEWDAHENGGGGTLLLSLEGQQEQSRTVLANWDKWSPLQPFVMGPRISIQPNCLSASGVNLILAVRTDIPLCFLVDSREFIYINLSPTDKETEVLKHDVISPKDHTEQHQGWVTTWYP